MSMPEDGQSGRHASPQRDQALGQYRAINAVLRRWPMVAVVTLAVGVAIVAASALFLGGSNRGILIILATVSLCAVVVFVTPTLMRAYRALLQARFHFRDDEL